MPSRGKEHPLPDPERYIRQTNRPGNRRKLPLAMEQLDALLSAPADDDEEFEKLWAQAMATATQQPDLFPPTPNHRASRAAPLPTASSYGVPVRSSGAAPIQRRRKPVASVRAPPHALIEAATKLVPRPQPAQPACHRPKSAPVVGVRVQRSSAVNARKLAALLTEPPSPLSRPRAPTSRKTTPAAISATPADDPDGKVQYSAATAPKDRDRPKKPVPPPHHPTARQKARATLLAVFGGTLSDLEEEDHAPVTASITTQPDSDTRPVTTERAIPPSAPSTQPAALSTQPAAAANANEEGSQTPATPKDTPTSTIRTPVATTPRSLPSVPVRVNDDLIIHVPYHAARVSRVYKVRLATRRYTLRFDRTGRCHYVREFPA
ncbi:proteoglycan 4-like [Solenopsis invicta]|uniref:proteoglycan 4-like n=1 Tax=Solenopsis invicta TaxID=13686 RepID=UPI00193DE6C8|nr:proteoglycan 4-like [Solenopsis invicta]